MSVDLLIRRSRDNLTWLPWPWHGKAFHITGFLWGESAGFPWNPFAKGLRLSVIDNKGVHSHSPCMYRVCRESCQIWSTGHWEGPRSHVTTIRQTDWWRTQCRRSIWSRDWSFPVPPFHRKWGGLQRWVEVADVRAVWTVASWHAVRPKYREIAHIHTVKSQT